MTSAKTLYVAKLHWLTFFWPLSFCLASLFLGIEFKPLKEIALVFFIISLLWLGITWVLYHFSSLTIDKDRVIFRTGFFVRRTTDIPFSKIESVDIRQSLMGSLCRYGLLMITGTGGTKHSINFIDKPLTCRRYIEQQMHPPL